MMNFIYPLIADVNQKLYGFYVDDIVFPVEKFICEKLNIDWKINVIITTSMPQITIQEDGVGGRTYASDFLVLAINQENTTLAKCSEMLAHELAHAIRWGKNSEWSRNLFCELINEGLAVHIEAEFAKTQVEKTFFLETILGRSDEDNHIIFEKLKPELENAKYNYNEIFFNSRKLTRWAGYSVGYYMVKEYLRRTGKNIFDVLAEPYDNFLMHAKN